MATDQRGPFTIPSGKMLLRTLAYVWPASRPAAGVLADDGAGNLSLTPYGTPGNSAVGDSAAAGSATAVAHSDHVHGRETFATPTVTFTNVNSAGSSGHPLQSDCSFAVFDTTNPESETFGALASPSVGGANTVARRDHRHAMPADPNTVTTAVHGLPASVAVLGNRTASGEFIQHALPSVTYGAGSSLALNNWHQVAVTFPVAFAATPIVVLGGGDQANAAPGVALSISTTGFTIRVWDNQASSFVGSFGYVALGT